MKVTAAKVYLVDIAGRRPVIVELITDEGISGIGEAAVAYGIGASAAAAMTAELAEAFIVGKDPFRIEELWCEMYDHTFWAKGGGPIVFAGISAIETALWDIKGKALGVPVYELMGGMIRDKARVYANGWSFRCIELPDLARAAESAVKDGYDALKFYPLGRPDPTDPHGRFKHVDRREIDRAAEDLAVTRVRAVRDAIGPDVDLMLDVSGELTPDAIIRFARRIEEFDIFFLEEPVDAFDETALGRVAASVSMPLATGERVYTRYGFRRIFAQHPAVAVIQPDVGNTGGLFETKKIAAMAEAFNMQVQPHICASSVSTAAALQICACIPNLLIQEVYPYRVPEHFDIVDHAPELDVKDSMMPVPERAGIGVELNRKIVEPFLWAEVAKP